MRIAFILVVCVLAIIGELQVIVWLKDLIVVKGQWQSEALFAIVLVILLAVGGFSITYAIMNFVETISNDKEAVD